MVGGITGCKNEIRCSMKAKIKAVGRAECRNSWGQWKKINVD